MLKNLPSITFKINDKTYYLADITKNISAVSEILNETVYYNDYIAGDNETLEIISYKHYETVDYWWVIAIINKIYDYRKDLPVSRDMWLKKAWFKYNLKEKNINFNITDIERYLTNETHHYESHNVITHTGNILDFSHITETIDTSKYDKTELCPINHTIEFNAELLGDRISLFEYEHNLNEQKRKLKILQRKYIPQIVSELQGLLNVAAE